MRILNLPVEDDIADVYNTASARKKNRINSAINLMLTRFFKKDDKDVLSQLMSEISDESLQNGLTVAKLGELMEWDDETMKNLFGKEHTSNAR